MRACLVFLLCFVMINVPACSSFVGVLFCRVSLAYRMFNVGLFCFLYPRGYSIGKVEVYHAFHLFDNSH